MREGEREQTRLCLGSWEGGGSGVVGCAGTGPLPQTGADLNTFLFLSPSSSSLSLPFFSAFLLLTSFFDAGEERNRPDVSGVLLSGMGFGGYLLVGVCWG